MKNCNEKSKGSALYAKIQRKRNDDKKSKVQERFQNIKKTLKKNGLPPLILLTKNFKKSKI